MRKMALDLGDVNIGIALSDPLGIIAGECQTLRRTNLPRDIEFLCSLIKQKEVDTVVAGLPINMDGTKGIRVEKTYAFCEELKKQTPVKLEFMDERLTTVSAEKMLIEANVRREKRKTVIDQVAATIILQSYLDKINK